jgi:hypothetical protein
MSAKSKKKSRNVNLVQRIVSYLRRELRQEKDHHCRLGGITVPNRFFDGLSEEEIQAVCSQINEIRDLPLILGRHLKCSLEHYQRFPISMQKEFEWQIRNRIEAAIVHRTLKIPLSEYKDSYVLGRGDDAAVHTFVAKVTDVHPNPCIIPDVRAEAEVSLSVEFYADSSGLIKVPKKQLLIRRERCDLEYLFGKLTEAQLEFVKKALEREGHDFWYQLANL